MPTSRVPLTFLQLFFGFFTHFLDFVFVIKLPLQHTPSSFSTALLFPLNQSLLCDISNLWARSQIAFCSLG